MELINQFKTTFDSKLAVLICLFFIGIVNIPGFGELMLLLIAMLSIGFVVKNRINPFTDPDLRLLSWLAISVIISKVISILVNEPGPRTYGNLGTSVHFLLAPFIAAYLTKVNWNREVIWIGVKAGAFLAGCIALMQDGRAKGAVNEIVFGDIALLLALISVVRLPIESRTEKAFSVVAFLFGMVAVVESETRGAWLALPVLLPVLFYCWYKMVGGRFNTKIALIIAALVAVSALIIVSTPQFKGGMKKLSNQVERFEKGSQNTSIGLRLAILYGSVEILDEKPLLGFGPANGSAVVSDFVADKVKQRVASFSHLHNEYLTTYVEQGIVGLTVLLMLILMPVVIALRSIWTESDLVLQSVSLLTVTGYSVFGLTNLALGHGVMNSFFVLLLAIALPAGVKGLRDSIVHSGTHYQQP